MSVRRMHQATLVGVACLTLAVLPVSAGLTPGGFQATAAAASSRTDYLLTVVAGTGLKGDPFVAGPALATGIPALGAVAADASGRVSMTMGRFDLPGQAVGRFDPAGGPQGTVTTIVNAAEVQGPPVPGPAIDSPLGTSGSMALPIVATDAGALYLGDMWGSQLLHVDTSGQLSVIGGNGERMDYGQPLQVGVEPQPGTPGLVRNGPALDTPLMITTMTLAPDGSLYAAVGYDYENRVVRIADGQVTIVAGRSGAHAPVNPGPAPGVLAMEATLGQVAGLAVDAAGNLFILDTQANCLVMKSAATGRLSTVDGQCGHYVDETFAGPARATGLNDAHYLGIDGAGDLYFVARSEGRVWKVLDPASNTPVLAPIMGRGWWHEQAIDGPARASGTGTIFGLSVRPDGTVYVGDTDFGQLMKLTPTQVTAPPSGSWYRDPVSAAARAKQIAVPANPDRYRGPQAYTRALYRAGDGRVVMPMTSLKGRALGLKQGAVLSGDGLFNRYSSALSLSGKAQVRGLAASLGGADSIRCEGYADYYGGAAANRRLALARAKIVCAELSRLGVTATMRPVSYGEARPARVGGSAKTRAVNRRVVVQVTGVRS